MTRKEFSKAVKVARLKHAMREGALRCEGCGVLLKPGGFAFDHDDPDGLTGEPTFENCRVLCTSLCHKMKTKKDVLKIAKAKRVEAKHLGASQPKQQIKSRGFGNTKKREPKQPLRPRALYQDV